MERVRERALARVLGRASVVGWRIRPCEVRRWDAEITYKDGTVSFRRNGWLDYLKVLKEELEKEGLAGTEEYERVSKEIEAIEEEKEFWERSEW